MPLAGRRRRGVARTTWMARATEGRHEEETMSTQSEDPSRVRASDAEREAFAKVVQDAVGQGRLTLEEGEERLAQVYAAKFRDELDPLVADLPEAHARTGRGWSERGGARGGWAGRGSGGGPGGSPRGPGRDPGYRPGGAPGEGDDAPPEWVRRWAERGYRRGYRPFLAGPLLIAAVLITIWALTGAHFFWPLFPLLFLGFVVFRRACWFGRWSRRSW
jgi:hypothetical protein